MPSSMSFLEKEKNLYQAEAKQGAFNTAQSMLAKEAISYYPHFSRVYEIHSDANDYQLGAVMSEDGKAYYTHKLNLVKNN